MHFLLRSCLKTGFALSLSVLAACSTTEKHHDSHSLSTLSQFSGKKIALVNIEGESTSKKVVEVALVNQLIQRGTFILLPKQKVERTRAKYDIDPLDWSEVAERAGADYALTVRVLEFEADVAEGYSSEEKFDPTMAKERGEQKGVVQRIYKVAEMEGRVSVELKFTDLTGQLNPRTALAEHKESVVSDTREEAIHLPPKLRFLEKVANRAFENFFERYQ